MANNLENRDAYLIYGANDDGSVCGIEKTNQSRLTSKGLVDFCGRNLLREGIIHRLV